MHPQLLFSSRYPIGPSLSCTARPSMISVLKGTATVREAVQSSVSLFLMLTRLQPATPRLSSKIANSHLPSGVQHSRRLAIPKYHSPRGLATTNYVHSATEGKMWTPLRHYAAELDMCRETPVAALQNRRGVRVACRLFRVSLQYPITKPVKSPPGSMNVICGLFGKGTLRPAISPVISSAESANAKELSCQTKSRRPVCSGPKSTTRVGLCWSVVFFVFVSVFFVFRVLCWSIFRPLSYCAAKSVMLVNQGGQQHHFTE